MSIALARRILRALIFTRDVRGGVFFPAGWGENENPWGGVGRVEDENLRGGSGRSGAKKRLNQLIQKIDKSAQLGHLGDLYYSMVF